MKHQITVMRWYCMNCPLVLPKDECGPHEVQTGHVVTTQGKICNLDWKDLNIPVKRKEYMEVEGFPYTSRLFNLLRLVIDYEKDYI